MAWSHARNKGVGYAVSDEGARFRRYQTGGDRCSDLILPDTGLFPLACDTHDLAYDIIRFWNDRGEPARVLPGRSNIFYDLSKQQPTTESWSALMSTNFTQRFNLPAVLLIASLLPLTGVVAWALTQMTSDYNLSGTYLAPSMAAQAVPHYVLRLAIAICIMAFGLVALIPTAVLTLRCWWPVLIAMMPLAALIGSSVSTFTTEVIGANIGAGGSLIGLLGTVPAELIVVPYLVYSTVRGAALGKGWLPDPRQSDQLRYFDKRTWTDKTTTDPTVLLAWAGWYPDPWNASQQRIFNGTTWISDTRTTPPKYLPYRGTKT